MARRRLRINPGRVVAALLPFPTDVVGVVGVAAFALLAAFAKGRRK